MRGELLLGCALAALLVAGFARTRERSVPAENSIQGDAQHGRYLVEFVAKCVECHSPRDSDGNLIESQALLGAPIPVGPPPWRGEWAIRAPRIRGLPGYDEAGARRLLTEGSIGRDGKRLKPPMPSFRMSPQDAADVIRFLRSQD